MFLTDQKTPFFHFNVVEAACDFRMSHGIISESVIDIDYFNNMTEVLNDIRTTFRHQ